MMIAWLEALLFILLCSSTYDDYIHFTGLTCAAKYFQSQDKHTIWRSKIAKAENGERELSFEVFANQGRQVSGGKVFSQFFKQCESEFDVIEANWIKPPFSIDYRSAIPGEHRTNLESYLSALKNHKDPKEAAKETFTGKMSIKFGFTDIEIVHNSPDHVKVRFRKTETKSHLKD